jgi:hypothetical protein
VTRFPGIHGGSTAVVSLKHDETSQNGRISLVDSWKTGHSNDPSIWPALKKMSRERAKVDTLVSCVFGMGEHGGPSMPFGWAGDAAWRATMSIRRAPIPTLGPERREDPSAGRGRGGRGAARYASLSISATVRDEERQCAPFLQLRGKIVCYHLAVALTSVL